MVSEMMSEILKAEKRAAVNEAKAQKEAERIIAEAKHQADIFYKAAIEQAESEAAVLVSEAKLSADGVIKQAESLAALREKKVINNTEKKYDSAIALVFENINR